MPDEHSANETRESGAQTLLRDLVALLHSWGWEVERREPDASPRPMAQLAAAEPDARRVVLYIPCLRWVAAHSPGAHSVELLALAHEMFHVLDERLAGTSIPFGTVPPGGAEFRSGLWDGDPPTRKEAEAAARKFAESLCFESGVSRAFCAG